MQAKGTWVKSAYASIVQSNKEAAQILSTFQCSACTDITGFGLMGHLLEMIKFDDDNDDSEESGDSEDVQQHFLPVHSDEAGKKQGQDDDANNNLSHQNAHAHKINIKIAVELSLSAIPLLLGSVECVRDGVFSSLHPQNIRCSRAVGNIQLGQKYFSYPLLYDPQVRANCRFLFHFNYYIIQPVQILFTRSLLG